MFLTLVVLCATLVARGSAGYPYSDTQDLVYNVPKVYRISLSLDKMLDFFERKPSLDPEWYIALGIARGQLEYTINQLDEAVPGKLRENLRNVTRRMDRVGAAAAAAPALLYRSKDYEYVARSILKNVAEHPSVVHPLELGALSTTRPHRYTFEQYVGRAEKTKPSRKVADRCTMQLLVSAMESQRQGAGGSCELAADCQDELLKGSALAFQMTSRLRAAQLANMFDCMEKGVFDWHIQKMCDQIYKETLALEAWKYPVGTNTLFMQQIFYCSIQGYAEFLKPRWMNAIISWQRPKGCYADDRQSFHRLTGYTAGGEQTGRDQEYRRKQAARADGAPCNSLTSGMALGSLAMYVRALLETPS